MAEDLDTYLLKQRVIVVGREIDDEMANLVMAQLLFLDSDPEREITFRLNSPGGAVTAALAIYDTIKYVKPPVATCCVGRADGMAALLLAAGAPGRRSAMPMARITLFKVTSGNTRGVDPTSRAREIEGLTRRVEELMSENTHQPIERIREDMNNNLVMTADEARDYGLIDRVESSKAP